MASVGVDNTNNSIKYKNLKKFPDGQRKREKNKERMKNKRNNRRKESDKQKQTRSEETFVLV